MKKIIFLILLGISIKLKSQNVSYTVEVDDPSRHPKLSINTDLFQLDAAFRNIEGMSFNLGVWGYYEPVYGKIGINFLARRSWLSLAKLSNKNFPAVYEADAGAYLILGTRTKTKKLKVVLKSTESTNSAGNRVTTTTFIMVPGKIKTMSGLRAGIYHKSSPMTLESGNSFAKDITIDLETKISSQAFYAGLFSRKITNLGVRADGYGYKINSLGREFYLDAMLFLNNGFKAVGNDKFGSIPDGTNVKDTVKANSKQGIFGVRFGYKYYQVAPKSESTKKFGMSATFEVGYRPFHGIFMNAGIGITFVKRRPKI